MFCVIIVVGVDWLVYVYVRRGGGWAQDDNRDGSGFNWMLIESNQFFIIKHWIGYERAKVIGALQIFKIHFSMDTHNTISIYLQ